MLTVSGFRVVSGVRGFAGFRGLGLGLPMLLGQKVV